MTRLVEDLDPGLQSNKRSSNKTYSKTKKTKARMVATARRRSRHGVKYNNDPLQREEDREDKWTEADDETEDR